MFGTNVQKLHLACTAPIIMKCLAVTFIQDEIIGRQSASSSSVATSVMDDTSPESAVGKKSESGIISISLKQL